MTSCEELVKIGTDDEDLPSATASVFFSPLVKGPNGLETTGNRSINEVVNTSENTSKSVEVLPNNPKVPLFYLSSGRDPKAVKSYKLFVVSGGNLQYIKKTEDGSEKVFAKEQFVESMVVEDSADETLFVGGQYIFDSDEEPMVIQAEAEDFAGNTSLTPQLTLIPKKEVKLRVKVNGNLIDQNRRYLRYSIDLGETVTIEWETENAESIKSEGLFNIGEKLNGQYSTRPNNTVKTSISASNSVSINEIELIINVIAPPKPAIMEFDLNPRNIIPGESSTISWKVQDATSISISPGGYQNLPPNGTLTVNPTSTTTFTLTAKNQGGSVKESATLTVKPPCWTTPQNLARFSFGGNLNNGVKYWVMDIIFPSDNRRITKITNKSSGYIELYAEGYIGYVALNPGQSTTSFNGFTVSRKWEVLTLENFNSLTGPQIEFCFK